MMNAQEAIAKLKPADWARTTPARRVHLLKMVRTNLSRYGEELAAVEAQMKNALLGEELYSAAVALTTTVLPLCNTVTACISLYETLHRGVLPQPVSVTQVGDELYDVQVFPAIAMDKIIYADRKDYLRIRGAPRQTNPLDKPPGIIAVLGAGNYASSLELIKGIFLANCAVVHKPHPLNQKCDEVWAKILQPLVEVGALSFCSADQGSVLTKLPGISKIYFTGGVGTANAILASTDTELVSECGGNSPCVIVPGDRPWTPRELRHQAVQIVSMVKLNGGATCARPQTVVTSLHWPQRQEFLSALRKAIVEDTPATGSYYPGSAQVAARFRESVRDFEVLRPEGGGHSSSEFLLASGPREDSFLLKNEAFCQILAEVPLDVAADAGSFLSHAAAFCNERILGTLCCSILIDPETLKAHRSSLERAINDLQYGSISVNAMPVYSFISPHLYWGGHETGSEVGSGRGHFGNVLGYEQVDKSISYSGFMSLSHFLYTHKKSYDELARNLANYSTTPSWINVAKLGVGAVLSRFRGKDF